MKKSVGDYVFVPNAYDVKWEPCFTKIECVEKGNYYCKVRKRNLSSFNAPDDYVEYPFSSHEVFSNVDDCKEYIDDYYYDGYCKECKYFKDAGTILKCSMCSHVKKRYCELNNLQVCTDNSSSREICKNYHYKAPQYAEWDWNKYADLLVNCEFNQLCDHHSKSCHKTCSFDRYMNEYVKIPLNKEFNGRQIQHGLIKRHEWFNQSFVVDDGYLVWGVGYKPELTKTGKIKKGTVNQGEMFDERKRI